MNIKQLEELLWMEQELDIAMKDRFHKTLTTEPKGSYPAETVKESVKSNDDILIKKLEQLKKSQS